MRTPAGDVWISVSQFRTHMHRVLREVESGQTFTITRSGRAVARLVGLAPEVIEDSDLEGPIEDEQLPLPPEWRMTTSGKPMPNVVRAVRRSRAGH